MTASRKDQETYPDGYLIGKHSWHFHQRLWQREKIRLRVGEYGAIRRSIRDGKAQKVCPNKRGANTWAVPFRNSTLFVMAAQNNDLITLLPPREFMFENGRWKPITAHLRALWRPYRLKQDRMPPEVLARFAALLPAQCVTPYVPQDDKIDILPRLKAGDS